MTRYKRDAKELRDERRPWWPAFLSWEVAVFPNGRVRNVHLQRFFEQGAPVSTFIDDVPKERWDAYGEDSVVICNGCALLILPGVFQPPEFNALREKVMAGRSIPKWQNLMGVARLSPALLPVQLHGKPLCIRGEGKQAPTVELFRAAKESPEEWVKISVVYVDIVNNGWGGSFCRPCRETPTSVPLIPVSGHDKNGRMVIWGVVAPVKFDGLEPSELFVADQIAKAQDSNRAALIVAKT